MNRKYIKMENFIGSLANVSHKNFPMSAIQHNPVRRERLKTVTKAQTNFGNPIISGDPELVTVKWFEPSKKGFGFVIDSNKKELFVHISVVKNSGLTGLQPGQEIIIQRGPSAKPGQFSVNHIVVNGNVKPTVAI